MSKIRIALVQLTSGRDVDANLKRCAELADEAADSGARWLLFPENAPFLGADRERFQVVQGIDGPMIHAYQEMALKHDAWVTVGGFPEAVPDRPDRTYNTQVLIDPKGEVHSSYRKIHLFDAQVDKDISYCESDYIEPGDDLVVSEISIDGQSISVGMSICYDLRFPALYQRLRAMGADVLTVPSAFTLQTGRDHWDALLRARAIENQCYVLAPDQYGHHFGTRWSYGHTAAYDPWGNRVARHRTVKVS